MQPQSTPETLRLQLLHPHDSKSRRDLRICSIPFRIQKCSKSVRHHDHDRPAGSFIMSSPRRCHHHQHLSMFNNIGYTIHIQRQNYQCLVGAGSRKRPSIVRKHCDLSTCGILRATALSGRIISCLLEEGTVERGVYLVQLEIKHSGLRSSNLAFLLRPGILGKSSARQRATYSGGERK
jgi:hypothetical protein